MCFFFLSQQRKEKKRRNGKWLAKYNKWERAWVKGNVWRKKKSLQIECKCRFTFGSCKDMLEKKMSLLFPKCDGKFTMKWAVTMHTLTSKKMRTTFLYKTHVGKLNIRFDLWSFPFVHQPMIHFCKWPWMNDAQNAHNSPFHRSTAAPKFGFKIRKRVYSLFLVHPLILSFRQHFGGKKENIDATIFENVHSKMVLPTNATATITRHRCEWNKIGICGFTIQLSIFSRNSLDCEKNP